MVNRQGVALALVNRRGTALPLGRRVRGPLGRFPEERAWELMAGLLSRLGQEKAVRVLAGVALALAGRREEAPQVLGVLKPVRQKKTQITKRQPGETQSTHWRQETTQKIQFRQLK